LGAFLGRGQYDLSNFCIGRCSTQLTEYGFFCYDFFLDKDWLPVIFRDRLRLMQGQGF
jgi:hypothetical protein